jgi:DNA-binding MarR family transcriptional regulator
VQAIDAHTQESPASVKTLAEELLLLWRHILRGGSRPLYELFAELDLSITHMKALHTLAECEPEISVKELGERLGLSLPAASRTTDALVRRDFLERREDEHDRRIRRVRITDAGRDVVRRIDEARLVGLEQFALSLTPEQRDRLAAALADLPHHP